MKKLVLIVDKRCRNCKYILKNIHMLRNYFDIDECLDIKSRDGISIDIDAVPALIVDGEVEYILGNIYGVLKLIMFLKKYCLGGENE